MAQSAVPPANEQQIAALDNRIATVSEDLQAVEADLRCQGKTSLQIARDDAVIPLRQQLERLYRERERLLPLPAQPAQQTDYVSKFTLANQPLLRDVAGRYFPFALRLAVANASAEPQLVAEALQVPRTRTKTYFKHNEWHVDGVVYMENKMFWKLFHVGESATYVCKGVALDSKEGEIFPRLQRNIEYIDHPDPGALARLDCLVPVHPLRVTVTDPTGAKVVKSYVRMPLYVSTANDLPVPCAESLVFTIASRISDALSLMWSVSKYHCDIKPANIFLDTAGVARLGDFGSVCGALSEYCATTLPYVPTDIQPVAGRQLDASMLLCTVAALLRWYTPLDGERISILVIEEKARGLSNSELQSLTSRLLRELR